MKRLIIKLLKFYKISKTIKFGSLWNFIHGFSMETVKLNGITKENYKSFMSDRQYWWGHPYNGTYSSIIDNKLYLPNLLKNYPAHTPQYYYFLNNHIYQLGTSKSNVAEFTEFINLLQEKGRLVLNHTCSSLGQGFHLVEYSSSDFNGGGICLINKSLHSTNLKNSYSL